jgi:glycosyltransferase involved in cell wall biosynthesis
VAQRLAEHGLALVVLSGEEPAESAAPPPIELGKPCYRPLGSRLRRNVPGRDIVEQMVIPRGLGRALRDLAPAIIVTEDLSGLPGNLQIPLYRSTTGCPYLIWTLGPAIHGKRRSWYRMLAMPVFSALRRPAAGFICYSRWAAEQLGRAYGKPCFVAPNATARVAVDLDLARLPTITGDTIRAIFIGRVTAQKKLDVLFQAIVDSDVRVELTIVGDGDQRVSPRGPGAPTRDRGPGRIRRRCSLGRTQE